MKKPITFLASIALAAISASAIQTTYTQGAWSVDVTDTGRLTIRHGQRELFTSAYATAEYNLGGSDQTVAISTGAGAKTVTAQVTDEIGDCLQLQTSVSDESVTFTQRINLYANADYITLSADLKPLAEGATVESRNIVPLYSLSSYPMGEDANYRYRALFVPFDNDSFSVLYGAYKFPGDMNSNEVSAIFDPTTREGVVFGSIEHDKWKSGVIYETKSGGRVRNFQLLSGFTHSTYTRDGLPHGKVKGATVASARYMVGHFTDWRQGMNTFGDLNIAITPRPEWAKGNPIGWNSWGNMMENGSYTGVVETAQFMKDNLWKHGFHDNDGKITISLDSFMEGYIGDDATMTKLGTKVFCDGKYTELQGFKRVEKDGLNMIMGLYGGMVVWDWTFDSQVPGTGIGTEPSYTWRDCTLKVNGQPYKTEPNNDGLHAYAIDPTHPAYRANLERAFRRWNSFGVKYVKMDFLNSGIREGDSWYNPEVTTGVMAYNYGMNIVYELASQYGMYVVESIAPLFPYNYAHGRRVCCDSWGSIEHSEFEMNAISYGWWTDRLYTVNDGDQMTFHQRGNKGTETEGENRARATTGMCTGAFLFGDNFSDNLFYKNDTDYGCKAGDPVGFPASSRERAMKFMANEDVNDYVRNNTGSFMPVYGDRPTSGRQSESVFMRDTEQYLYVAVFNFSRSKVSKGSVTFDDLGIEASNVGAIKELWSGNTVQAKDGAIEYEIPKADAAVYRISKNDYSDINSVALDERVAERPLLVHNAAAGIMVEAPEAIDMVSVYAASGALCGQAKGEGIRATVGFAPAAGLYIVEARLASGRILTAKTILK